MMKDDGACRRHRCRWWQAEKTGTKRRDSPTFLIALEVNAAQFLIELWQLFEQSIPCEKQNCKPGHLTKSND